MSIPKVTFAGQKGGTGKSTCAMNFAAEAMLNGHEVRIIDLDPQASIAFWADDRALAPPKVVSGYPSRLKQMLAEAEADGVTFIVIDTSSSVGETVSKAAEHSDLAILPTLPVLIEIRALIPTVNIIRQNHAPAKILFSRVDRRTNFITEGKKAVKHYELDVIPTHIVQRAAFVHAYNRGKTIQEYQPHSESAREIRAVYAHITKELGIHNGKTK